MKLDKRTIAILGASLLTAALVAAIIYFAVPFRLLNGVRREFDYPIDLMILMLGDLILYLLASVPSTFLLRRQNVSRSASLSVFAVTEAWLLAYCLSPIVVDIFGLGAAIPSAVVLILVCYAAGDFILNTWSASKNRKIGLAIALVLVTMLVSVFLPRF